MKRVAQEILGSPVPQKLKLSVKADCREEITAPGSRSACIHVSIVEDDDWLRDNIAERINRTRGFRCVSRHRNGPEALGALPAAAPDVILMDINLPKMSGIECLHRLKTVLPDANVLMLTVYEDTDRIFDSLKAGASGYLLKRTPHGELMKAIEDVHRGGSPITSVIARKVVDFFKQRSQMASEVDRLSPREREILSRLGDGDAYKGIADSLGLSVDTVRMHIRGIYKKLQVHSRGEAVAKYLRI